MSKGLEPWSAQVARDIKHHQERVVWLSAKKPTWACGTPVAKSDQIQMLNASKAVLENPSLGSNTGPQR